jgi:hypothetical protein
LAISEVFTGGQIDDLIRALRKAVRESQTLNTGPLLASIDNQNSDGARFTHTIVPIDEANGSKITRLFLYSEKAE